MYTPETIAPQARLTKPQEKPRSAFERLRYLCPSRYFRYYMFHERTSKKTCWLPEGYDM